MCRIDHGGTVVRNIKELRCLKFGAQLAYFSPSQSDALLPHRKRLHHQVAKSL
jgi:hypothetical protein